MKSTISQLAQVLADESFMGIFVIDKNSNECVYLNKLAYELLEIDPGTDLNSLKYTLMCPDSDHPEMRSFSSEILEHDAFHQELMLQKNNRMRFIASMGVKNVCMDDSEFTIIMFEDVTFEKKLQRELQLKQDEIKKAYEELLEQNEQLKELDHAKDKFIALTTHELRTPLAAMVATADVLVHELYDGEEMLKEYIQTIHEQGNHMMALVNDILDFAKIQAGRMDYFVEHLDLREVCHQIFSEFEHMAEGKNLEMNFGFEEEEHLAYFDKLRLTQVVSNVILERIKRSVSATIMRFNLLHHHASV